MEIFRSETHHRNSRGKGQKQSWQKNGLSPFFRATGIYYPVIVASQGTLNDCKHFLPFSKPTGRAATGDIILSAPAVKHTKANYAMKQTPETHALAGNLYTGEALQYQNKNLSFTTYL